MSPQAAAKDALLEQVETILRSRLFHGSESLPTLLRYLATFSLEHPGVSPKEYQIATEAFGRSTDFDPHVDSMVRVQAGRLRSKLAEYYANEGNQDRVLVEMPRGTYALAFTERPAKTAPQTKGATETAKERGDWKEAVEHQAPLRTGLWAAAGLSAIILAAVLAVGIDRFWMQRGTAKAAASEPPAALKIFWDGYLGGHTPPLVVFSNAPFVGRPDTGMRYFEPQRDKNVRTLDHYTGVGEVLAVHALDEAFFALGQKIRVKRGSLFMLDDAKSNNLIFIGSPSENLSLLDIPTTKDFQFRKVTCCGRQGNVEILNLHPVRGEASEFLATPSNEPLSEDYAMVAMEEGPNGGYKVLTLAGTTTIGTQAAVEFVCDSNSLQLLLSKLDPSGKTLKPFEAVLRVRVARGVPVSSELVAVHTL